MKRFLVDFFRMTRLQFNCQKICNCPILFGSLGTRLELNTITADISLQQSLTNLPGLTEVRDTQGIVIGYFSPACHKNAEAYAQAAAHFDPNEMKERKRSAEKGRTTDEVLSRISSLNQ